MFNTLYRCSRTIARHENGPLAESRSRYLEHLSTQGAALHTIRAAAGVIYRATILMHLDESSPVERKDVEHAAKRWAHRWYRNASSRGPNLTDKEFRQTTCNWLRFARRLRESDRTPAPHQQQIDAFCQYMDVERGLSPKTIESVRQSTRKFSTFFRHSARILVTSACQGTQRYLTMTPELLAEAALRFAHYAEEVSRGQA